MAIESNSFWEEEPVKTHLFVQIGSNSLSLIMGNRGSGVESLIL